ncbi:MAG: DMT family transporter [Actinomycetota bacterium]
MQEVQSNSTALGRDLPGWVPWTLLVLGTFAASVSAILIKYAQEADALALSFWRCSAGAAVLAPFARAKLKGIERRDLRPAIIAGVFLTVHFATWITSLELTSVAISVLLVSTAPIFVAIAARFLLNDRLSTIGWSGIGLAFLGTLLIGGTDFEGSSLAGSILALIGGATAGWYVLAGQVARRDLGILEYAVIAYTVSAVLLLPVCLATDTELWGYGATTWWSIAGLIVGPQLLGHTVINYVLSDIDATTVSVVIMAEPIIAILLAVVLFDEVPSWLVYPAGMAILAGIYLVSTARREATPVLE